MNIYEEKERYTTMLKAFEPFENCPYIRKYGESKLAELKRLIEKYNPMPQEIQTFDGKMINLTPMRERLKALEEMVVDADRFKSCPALEEYNQALSILEKAERQLKEEFGSPLATAKAKRLGLTRAMLTY